jgi:hypothetical protein
VVISLVSDDVHKHPQSSIMVSGIVQPSKNVLFALLTTYAFSQTESCEKVALSGQF